MSEKDLVKTAAGTLRTFLRDNRLTIVGILVIVGFIFQGYFMYLTATSKRARNLLIIEKSPYRIIARWDSFKNEGTNMVLQSSLAKEREMWNKIAKEVKFYDYKFNENFYIRVNTLDAKSDEAKVNLNELSSISDSSTEK